MVDTKIEHSCVLSVDRSRMWRIGLFWTSTLICAWNMRQFGMCKFLVSTLNFFFVWFEMIFFIYFILPFHIWGSCFLLLLWIVVKRCAFDEGAIGPLTAKPLKKKMEFGLDKRDSLRRNSKFGKKVIKIRFVADN